MLSILSIADPSYLNLSILELSLLSINLIHFNLNVKANLAMDNKLSKLSFYNR